MHEDNTYLTLTYHPDHLPPGQTLDHNHFQKFIRALRKSTGKKIRFYMCGEYGEKKGRPHYHALLFGYKFPDTYLWRSSRGNQIYRSPTLEKVWTLGNSEIGEVTFKSAAYVARYIMKKQYGDQAKEQLTHVDLDTGEILEPRKPEYTRMSLKPGIGFTWYQKYYKDVFPNDTIVLTGGKEMPTPKYYRDLLKKHPEII